MDTPQNPRSHLADLAWGLTIFLLALLLTLLYLELVGPDRPAPPAPARQAPEFLQ